MNGGQEPTGTDRATKADAGTRGRGDAGKKRTVGRQEPTDADKSKIPLVEFSADEMDALLFAAIVARTLRLAAGMRTESYQEKRYAFAKDWAADNRWDTPRTRTWARRIKGEVAELLKQQRPVVTAEQRAEYCP